jgi:D-amino-acid dehydrogenase
VVTSGAVDTVTVVGGGVVGLSCAFHLASSGAEVTVVESAGIGSGASRTNAGWLVPSMCEPVPSPAALRVAAASLTRRGGPLRVGWEPSPRYVAFLARMLAATTPAAYARGSRALERLGVRALRSFDELADAGVELARERRGVLLLFLDRAHLAAHAGHLAAADRGTTRFQNLTPAELREVVPAVGPRVVGGLMCPDDQHVDPSALVDGLAAACRERGVRLVTGATALTVRTTDRGLPVVETTRGAVHGDAVVVAAGIGTRALLAASGVRVALRAGKGYGVDYAAAPVDLPTCAYLAEHRVAVTPLGSRLRLAGTMAFGDETLRVSPRRIDSVVSPAGHYFEGWPDNPRGGRVAWSGLRPMTPDGLPLIGRLPGQDRVLLATGHAMLGVTLGPVTGSLVADLVQGRISDLGMLSAFRPGRFTRGAIRASDGRVHRGVGAQTDPVAPGPHSCPQHRPSRPPTVR